MHYVLSSACTISLEYVPLVSMSLLISSSDILYALVCISIVYINLLGHRFIFIVLGVQYTSVYAWCIFWYYSQQYLHNILTCILMFIVFDYYILHFQRLSPHAKTKNISTWLCHFIFQFRIGNILVYLMI